MQGYDFLAGEQRYKANLGGVAVPLHWFEMVAGSGISPSVVTKAPAHGR
jgi:hypothetical protein